VLDLKNSFFHVSINDNNIKYNAFQTDSTNFEKFLSATIFQKFINAVFRDHIALCLGLNNH